MKPTALPLANGIIRKSYCVSRTSFYLVLSTFFFLLLSSLLSLPSTLNAQTQIGMDIDGEAAQDQSGWSVSFSSDGRRVAIGAQLNDDNGNASGHVRIYEESGGVWTQVGGDIDGEAAQDESGYSVSLSSDGRRVAIGARLNDDNGNASGHVRIYEESGGVWTQVGGDIDGEAPFDQSGYSVSLSSDGRRVAIGAPGNDDNGGLSGHVRIYEESGGVWTQVGGDIDGEAQGDQSGWSVSLSSDGRRVAIGARLNDDNGNASGHVRIYEESGGVWMQVGSDIDGAAAGDRSGWSVSISSDGRRVAIGAPFSDGNGDNSGHVRIYEESGGVWTQVGGDIDGAAAFDQSGYSVSLSSDGRRVAIGAPFNDGNGSLSGHVRIYEESGGVWTQVGGDIDGEAAGDLSGYSVSLSSDGRRVAIGALLNDGNGTSSGHVRIYELDPPLCDLSELVLEQVGLDIDGEAANDQSGYSVSFSSDGRRVAIGALFNDGNGTNSGHVRIYEESGGVWTQVGLDIDGAAPFDQSGYSVSLSSDGRRVAIGAPGNDDNGGLSGHVRIYEESGGVWTQVGGDIDGEAQGDQSGWSVSLSSDGRRVAIGARLNDDNGNASGHVRIYEESGGVWTQVGGDIDGADPFDQSGLSVSISSDGRRVAIGAIGNDDNGSLSGHVRIYEESGGVWTQVGGDIDGEAASDQSGSSVSLSSDGRRVAIGAQFNDGNGTSSGHVRIYEESSGVWTQVGLDIDGAAAGDDSGYSVSLSSDGRRVAIGAPGNVGNGPASGHVRIYEESGGVWTQVGGDIDGEAQGDQSGWSVSISSDGRRVAIGAPGNDGNGPASGHVRIYEEKGCPPCEVPVAVCKADTFYLDASGMTMIIADSLDGGSTAECGLDTLIAVPDIMSCDSVGERMVDLIVVDLNGDRDTCTATVTILDTIKPTLACTDVTITLDGNGLAVIDSNYADNGSFDNCGIDSISLSQTMFTCLDLYRTDSIIMTVVDVSGNTDTCEVGILVIGTDDDNDGYFAECEDCNDNDPNINPGALEICGDNIDNNCDGVIDDVTSNGYCCATGTNPNAYIDQVALSYPFGNIVRLEQSGLDTSGYGNYTDPPGNIESEYVPFVYFSVTPGLNRFSFIRIWVDWNQNGDFDPYEMMVQNITNTTWNGQISVPFMLRNVPGEYTARIGLSQRGYIDDPCDEASRGEYEDYVICIANGCGGDDNPPNEPPAQLTMNNDQLSIEDDRIFNLQSSIHIHVRPNPFRDNVLLSATMEDAGPVEVRMIDQQGQVVLVQYFEASNGFNQVELTTQHLASGMYYLQVISGDKYEVLKVVKE